MIFVRAPRTFVSYAKAEIAQTCPIYAGLHHVGVFLTIADMKESRTPVGVRPGAKGEMVVAMATVRVPM